MPRRESAASASLREAFDQAAPAHFDWRTRGSNAEYERSLVRAAFLPLGERVLDLGCGEGATLYHLDEPEGAVGVDLFEAKIAFAERALPKCRFVTASALELPFEAGAFDHILVRDVIHHVPDPTRLTDECSRVLVRGGRIDVLEPCRYNPLIAAHALGSAVERGELRSTAPFLERLLTRSGFQVEATTHHQPFPLHRIVFHPRLGFPGLGERRGFRAAVDRVERLAARVLPRSMWAYLHVRATLL